MSDEVVEEHGETEGKVVIHRAIPGDHAIGRDCWCRPGVFDPENGPAIEEFASQDKPS